MGKVDRRLSRNWRNGQHVAGGRGDRPILAHARALETKHALKQVDRLLSSQNIDVWERSACWFPHLIGRYSSGPSSHTC